MRRFLRGRPFTVFVAFTIASISAPLALAFDCQPGAPAACVRPAHPCEDMPVMSCGCCGRESPATPAAARVQTAPLPTIEPAVAPGQCDLVDAEVRNLLYWCFQHGPRTPDLPTFLSTLLI